MTYKLLQLLQCDTTDIDMNKKSLISFDIYSANKSNVYNRKYIKVSDILASVGGLMQVFYIMFLVINKAFSEISKYEKIISQIFYFENNELSIIRNDSMSSKIIPFNRFIKLIKLVNAKPNISTNMNIMSNFSKQRSNVNQVPEIDMNKIVKDVFKRNEKILFKFSFLNKIRIICKKLCEKRYNREFRDKMYLFSLAKYKIKRYFDFINIIKKFEEFEKIKKVIFTIDQRSILKLNQKTKLSLAEKYKEDKFNEHEEAYTEDDIKEIFRDIIQRFNHGVQRNVDENLIKLY
jgi:hypothetical protein